MLAVAGAGERRGVPAVRAPAEAGLGDRRLVLPDREPVVPAPGRAGQLDGQLPAGRPGPARPGERLVDAVDPRPPARPARGHAVRRCRHPGATGLCRPADARLRRARRRGRDPRRRGRPPAEPDAAAPAARRPRVWLKPNGCDTPAPAHAVRGVTGPVPVGTQNGETS
ncbi:hypothetical protein SGPA1_12336 [Streptomyces misionensis JCM 4497]